MKGPFAHIDPFVLHHLTGGVSPLGVGLQEVSNEVPRILRNFTPIGCWKHSIETRQISLAFPKVRVVRAQDIIFMVLSFSTKKLNSL